MSNTALGSAYYTASKTISQARLSHQSLNDYKGILRLSLQQLSQLGFKLRSIDQLKQKHVDKLIMYWKESQLSSGTIKNRLSVLRRVTELTGREQVIKNNAEYYIAPRRYYTETSKAVHAVDFDRIEDSYVRASLELQKEFGLRREEAIKFKPHQADEKLAVRLQGSWTKGGIPRLIPITRQSQRECLDRIKLLVGKKDSLIPKELTYRQQRDRYDYFTNKNGYHKLHGLRHAYAQHRYEAITNEMTKGYGWKSPIDGGPSTSQMNAYEKHVDLQARLMISHELGHSRLAIVRSYCGK